MCFSAEASFIASAFCGVVAVGAINHAEKKTLLLAIIPLIFSLHQATEGVIWLSGKASCGIIGAEFYSLIASCLWPTYVPIAAWLAEQDENRHAWILRTLFIGLPVSIYNAYVFSFPLTVDFSHHQISYIPGTYYPLFVEFFYSAAVVIPFLLMSNKMLRYFGIVILLFFVLSMSVFNPSRYSVWCFFAAVSSVLIFLAVSSKNIMAESEKSLESR
ncbi:conserved membrane hypothetical protein [Gammaproteobacteria bacterium]